MNTILKYQYQIFLIISIIFIIGFLFQKPLGGEYTFGGPDSLSPSAIKQGIQMEESKNGEYPLWLPWVFSGLPSTHSFQNISEFYFPNFMVDIFKIIGLPAFWNYIFHFIIAGLGMFLLIRQIGLTNSSSFFGAISFVLMPYLITMVVHGHGSQMMTACWIPWIIWAIFKIFSNPSIISVGVLGIVVGFQLQRAHVQIAYYTWMAAGLLLCIFLYNYSKDRYLFKSFIYTLSGLFLGLCMSLSIYLPALNYTPYSIRGASEGGGASFEYATAWSFSFSELATFFIPSYYGFGGITYWGNMPFTDYPNYMGIIVLILGLIGLIFHKNKIKWYFFSVSIFALSLSFGKNFFLYEIFYNYFPYFNKFRVPVMLLILLQFAVSIFAALGLDYLIKLLNEKNIKQKLRSIFGLIGSVVLIIFYLRIKINFNSDFSSGVHPILHQLRLDMINTDIIYSIILIFFFFMACFLTYKKIISSNIFVSILISCSIIDFCIVNSKIIEPSKESYRKSSLVNNSFKENYLSPDEVIDFLKNDKDLYRILPIGSSLSGENRWSAFGIESILGYHPAKLYRYNLFKEEVLWIQKGVLQMLNVKYIISIEDFNHPNFEKVFSGKLFNQGKYIHASIYKFKDYIPRLFFTKNVKKIASLKDQVQNMKRKEFDPLETTLIEEDIMNIQYNPNSEAYISFWSPNKIEIKVDSDTDQFLVLSEMYYPNGWKVTSHSFMKIYPANMIMRGLHIPKGDYQITLEFLPNDIYYGNLISSFSSLLLLFFVIIGLVYKKNK